MYSLRYRITTLLPVVISTRSGDANMVKTERYIPGTVVMGILANRFIAMQKYRPVHANGDFYSWFLAGNVKIGNAYIFSWEENREYLHLPMPLSIEKEKHKENSKIAYDRLLGDPAEPTKHVETFCILNDGFLQTRSVATDINFHHARDREKGISKEGIIFNYESISVNQVFAGSICGELADLKNLLQICGHRWPAFIGRSRNAQYGAAEFEIIDDAPSLPQNPISWPSKHDDEKPAEYISMTLLSNLLLYNEFGYPTTEVSTLQDELQKYIGEVEIKKAFVKKAEVENFVGVWQLKKPSETCLAAGSTFLLKVDQNHLAQLAEIQQNGIGERRHEGFGKCAFGMQTHAVLNASDEAEDQAKRPPTKPQEPLPKTTKTIIHNIVENEIERMIELMAVQAQDDFTKLPSKTLIARLETMAKKAKNRSMFVENINKLRDIASAQLKRCVSRERNLLEFLATFYLDENSLAEFKKDGFDVELLDKLKSLGKNREFTIISDLERATAKTLSAQQKSQILRGAKFRVDPVNWEKFFDNTRNVPLRKLCEEKGVEFKPENDSDLACRLSQRYFTTFFAMMRQRTIAAEKEGYDV